MVISLKTDDFNIKIIHVYAPNSSLEKLAFFDELSQVTNKYTGNDFILLGDMNTVVDNNLDIISGRPHGKTEVDRLNEFVDTLGLCDVWRSFHEGEKEYTWSKQNPFIARRLDYCFVTETLVESCTSCDIISVPFTDHRAVALDISSGSFVRGPGYWHFNNALLQEKNVC
ncbi:hypothetical protein BaRGS_00033480 [Batillaria attramentaria]|uniref:Endonuclease/exonuclease/phosphatase domain-containing protein n=1 Tax=Batillaria attramentaria TaxID=370345 RepID=A0ABD0JJV9_9CAEN